MARIERGDQALDRAALAGGVPALEHDAHGRPEPAVSEQATERQPEREQPVLSLRELRLALLLGELLAEIDLVEAAHANTWCQSCTLTRGGRPRD